MAPNQRPSPNDTSETAVSSAGLTVFAVALGAGAGVVVSALLYVGMQISLFFTGEQLTGVTVLPAAATLTVLTALANHASAGLRADAEAIPVNEIPTPAADHLATVPAEPLPTPAADMSAARHRVTLHRHQHTRTSTEHADDPSPQWEDLAAAIDPRLTSDPTWPALHAALDRAHAAGYDVAQRLPELAAHEPLMGRYPSRELHHRLVDHCRAATTPAPNTVAEHGRPARTAPVTTPTRPSRPAAAVRHGR